MGRIRGGDGLADLLQQAPLVGAQRALEDQPVGGVIAAENCPFQFKSRQETFHFDE